MRYYNPKPDNIGIKSLIFDKKKCVSDDADCGFPHHLKDYNNNNNNNNKNIKYIRVVNLYPKG